MTECDAYNLIEEFIRQSYSTNEDFQTKSNSAFNNLADDSNSESTTSSHFNVYSKYLKTQNTDSFLNCDSLEINRTSESSASSKSESDDDGKPSFGPIKTYNEKLTVENEQMVALDQIFDNLNKSKTLHEKTFFMTPPYSEKQNVKDAILEKKEKYSENELNDYLEMKVTKVPEVYDNFYPQKPNRPYSYYAATNLNPLDFSRCVNDVAVTEKVDIKEVANLKEKNVQKRENKSNLTKIDIPNKRLSTSLGDLQILNSKCIKHVNLRENAKDKFSSQNQLATQCSCEKFERNQKLLKKAHRSRSSSRLNRFIRNIFKLDFKHNNEIKHLKEQNKNLKDKIIKKSVTNDLDDQSIHQNFTFTRLFSSFRGSHMSINTQNKNKRNHNSTSTNSTAPIDGSLKTLRINDSSTISDVSQEIKKELIVMDEQPSKSYLPLINIFDHSNNDEKNIHISEKLNDYSSSKTSTGYSSENSASPISNYEVSTSEIDKLRLRFYREIASRLKTLSLELKKKLITGKNKNLLVDKKEEISHSFNLDDVPYIDDDLDSNYDQSEKNELVSSYIDTYESVVTSEIFEENKISQFLNSYTSYEKLDKIIVDSFNQIDMTKWENVAAIFQFVFLSVKSISSRKNLSQENKNRIIQKIKEMIAIYLHDNFCDWIFENGGWYSVPDSKKIN